MLSKDDDDGSFGLISYGESLITIRGTISMVEA